LCSSQLNYSFPKSNRLRTKTDFKKLYESARYYVGGVVKIYFLPCLELSVPRLGISISSKYFNSKQRNSLKRLIREYFRIHGKHFLTMDLVVHVRYSKEQCLVWRNFLSIVRQDLERSVLEIHRKAQK